MAKLARVSILVLTIGSVLSLAPTSAQTSKQPAYDYDSMGPLPQDAQKQIWPALAPENVADVNRTKMLRWAVANRSRLSPEQLQFMYEFAASISADMYRRDRPATPETEARRQAFEARSRELFPQRGLWIEAFSFEGGGYIPPANLSRN